MEQIYVCEKLYNEININKNAKPKLERSIGATGLPDVGGYSTGTGFLVENIERFCPGIPHLLWSFDIHCIATTARLAQCSVYHKAWCWNTNSSRSWLLRPDNNIKKKIRI